MLLLAGNVIVVCTEYKCSLNGLLYEVGSLFRLLEKSLPLSCLKVPTHNNSALCVIGQIKCLLAIYFRLYVAVLRDVVEMQNKKQALVMLVLLCCAVFSSFPQTTSSYSVALESVFILYCDCLVCSHIVRIWS